MDENNLGEITTETQTFDNSYYSMWPSITQICKVILLTAH